MGSGVGVEPILRGMNPTWGPFHYPAIGAPSAAVWAWVKTLQAIALILSLSGCPATLPPAPTEVRIPVPVACIERSQLPAAPGITADSELAKLGDFDFVITLASDRIALRQHAREQNALLQGCLK